MALADDLKAKLELGRTAVVASLRALADQLEQLRLDDAAEALAWLEPALDRLKREAETILRGARSRSS